MVVNPAMNEWAVAMNLKREILMRRKKYKLEILTTILLLAGISADAQTQVNAAQPQVTGYKVVGTFTLAANHYLLKTTALYRAGVNHVTSFHKGDLHRTDTSNGAFKFRDYSRFEGDNFVNYRCLLEQGIWGCQVLLSMPMPPQARKKNQIGFDSLGASLAEKGDMIERSVELLRVKAKCYEFVKGPSAGTVSCNHPIYPELSLRHKLVTGGFINEEFEATFFDLNPLDNSIFELPAKVVNANNQVKKPILTAPAADMQQQLVTACSDPQRAACTSLKRTLTDSCSMGKMGDCFNLGQIDGAQKNPGEARQHFKKACDGGVKDACSFLATLEKKYGDKDVAIKLLEKSCTDGSSHDCFKLGIMESNRGNTARARELYKKACDSGVRGGCVLLENLSSKK